MAARPLSLSAYRALTRRAQPTYAPADTNRPAGDVLWIHLGSKDDTAAILDFSIRLLSLREALTILITLPPDLIGHWDRQTVPDGIILSDAPDEHPRSVASFLDHWTPDMGIWVWGGLRPNLIEEATKRGIPFHLISADTLGFDGRRDRWLPDLSRHLLMGFKSAQARSSQAAVRLKQLGMHPDQIEVFPALRASGRLLTCAASDLDELSVELAGRPIWLAAQCQAEEWPVVFAAHRSALRSAHRLLLVINPADERALEALKAEIETSGMSYAVWGDGEWPQETTQVLIADLPDELGLWYRLATVSFLGSSLKPGFEACDPMAAAALGTAILYGPNVRLHLASYSRLAGAGAARIVNDASSLGAAVAYLIAPDQAANMAHAGWEVVSEGAEVIDSLVDLVQDSLDKPD